MSMERDRPHLEKSATDAEGVMFPTNPIWERGNKRRGFGGRRAAPAEAAPAAAAPAAITPSSTLTEEPRTFAPEAYEEPMTLDRRVGETPSMHATEDPGLVAPIGPATTRVRKSGGFGPAIAVGAVAAIALAAGGGWYMTRDRGGVPQLAPGATGAQMATAPMPPPAASVPLTPSPSETAAGAVTSLPAAATAQAQSARTTTVRTERHMASAARARPAASSAGAASATTGSVDTSATLPDAPQPYSSLNPGAAPAPVNPAPATAAPAQPMPTTPPVAPGPAPTTQDATSATTPQ